MARACCAKPIVKIIKVGDVEAGLVGLEQALQSAYISGVSDEGRIRSELLQWIRDFGNYVASSREEAYKDALLREYKSYVAAIEQAKSRHAGESRDHAQNRDVLPRRKRWFHRR